MKKFLDKTIRYPVLKMYLFEYPGAETESYPSY